MKRLFIITMLIISSCTPTDDIQIMTKIDVIEFTQTKLYNEVEISLNDFELLLSNTNNVYIKRTSGDLEKLYIGGYILHQKNDAEDVMHYYFRMISVTDMIQPGNEIFIKK